MASMKTKSNAQGSSLVPARTTSCFCHEDKSPIPPPQSYQPVDRGETQPAADTDPKVTNSPNKVSKQSDLETLDPNDIATSGSDSTISIDEQHSPLPPLLLFKGNETRSSNHDTRTQVSPRGVAEMEDSFSPGSGPSIVQKDCDIDLPMRSRRPSGHERETQANGGPSSSRETPTCEDEERRSYARPASVSSSSEEVPTQNTPIVIPKIPPASPTISSREGFSILAAGLEGKLVDEFGNILDTQGKILGRVKGDLPSMVGRPVSSTGAILNAEGHIVGFVVENEILKEPQSLDGMSAGTGLRADHSGNILDRNGNIVGRMKDNNASFPDEPVPRAIASSTTPPSQTHSSENKKHTCACGQPKPSATPNPSEIYLDVKSTNDGIQLIIKIPTMFNKAPVVQMHT